MRRSSFAFASTFLSLLTMPFVLLARAASGFLSAAFALFAPSSMRLVADGYALPMSMGGVALARDVQQSLRHEAGVPRYSAARNT